MWISRVRVTGGFLNGLDVSFSKGLNVIIGARGAGKTTLLELMRHAVGARHADKSNIRQHQDFLDAVLGVGEVVLDIESEDGGRHLVVDARGGGQRPDLSNSVLVLGQNELENIASDGASRLNLLDLRTGGTAEKPDRGAAALLTAQLYNLRTELDTLKEELAKRSRLQSDREILQSQETAMLGGASDLLSRQREELRRKESQLISTTRELERLDQIQAMLASIFTAQEQQTNRIAGVVAEMAHIPQIAGTLPEVERGLELSSALVSMRPSIDNSLRRAAAAIREKDIELRESAAPLRAHLEQAESGLGQITSQLRNVDAELAALKEVDERITQIENRHDEISKQRALILDEVEAAEEVLFKSRAAIARATTAQITNNVVIAVDHLADSSSFRASLQDSLRGSNTRSTVIDAVADRVMPRQLLELIEDNDATGLAAAADLTPERADRLIQNLNNEDALQELARASLSDLVDFRLRDGITDKSVDVLSTGQKCAVTLPVILSEERRTLILDQPEDHLDNAYLVDHVVKGILNRNPAQTIVATHNANIPVLGSANHVVVLASDGRNGSVTTEGCFDDDGVVKWITGLMEGGRDAFARRSEFYASHDRAD